jgi:hypothetical protein
MSEDLTSVEREALLARSRGKDLTPRQMEAYRGMIGRMTPEQRHEFEAVQNERQSRRFTGFIPGSETDERPFQKVIPSGNWRGPYTTDSTVCVKRDIEIVQLSRDAEEYEHLEFGEDEECVSLPDTKRCILENEGKTTKVCDLVKIAYACADETSGMLTATQVAGLIGVEHRDVKSCIRDLVGDGDIKEPPPLFEGHALLLKASRRVVSASGVEVSNTTQSKPVGGEHNTWADEAYYTMIRETREKFLSNLT